MSDWIELMKEARQLGLTPTDIKAWLAEKRDNMSKKLEIIEQPFITSTGKHLDGTEKVVACPMWMCNVNVRKNCGKCFMKEKISYKEKVVFCKYKKK